MRSRMTFYKTYISVCFLFSFSFWALLRYGAACQKRQLPSFFVGATRQLALSPTKLIDPEGQVSSYGNSTTFCDYFLASHWQCHMYS